MRIVAIADTHTFEREFSSLIPDGDVLIHAGDLLRAGTLEELEPVADWLQSLPHAIKIVVAGNHDVCLQTQREAACDLFGPTIHYLQDEQLEICGLSFWGSPWTPLFHDWAFMLPRGDAIREKWRQIPDTVDVLITHGPPRGIGDVVGVFGHLGCEELAEEVARIRPILHLFGHSHTGGGVYFRDGICFANVTTWECERAATVFDLDPVSRLLSMVTVPPGNLYPVSG